ncbi:Nucleotide-binding universal stress protein, UspA family [Paenibacillus sp. UNC496MF]|uniref:universal stress protein n=1 Tax=Paenibacillus sp. UNC496MF TaxID=1502753 RepID=UPI0008E13673|nr:universal stress protein [Paenibacillus sp. UNC496MF]SFJ92244.1 Nucleotide-binding universal stress protein, UspA family [Paenibacillus sp. UNC496MF]
MLYRHILAAYDGSEPSERALRQAIGLIGEGAGTKLSVVHAVSAAPRQVGGVAVAPPDAYFKWLDEQNAAIERRMNEAAGALPFGEAVVLHGDPAHEIAAYAREYRVDLIVMGSRGLGKIREMMFGSVSHHVVCHTSVPVLIVK